MERPETKAVFLPVFVRMDIEWNDGAGRLFRFPVSHPFLRAFRPGGALSPLVYLNISEKKPSQQQDLRPSDGGKKPGRPEKQALPPSRRDPPSSRREKAPQITSDPPPPRRFTVPFPPAFDFMRSIRIVFEFSGFYRLSAGGSVLVCPLLRQTKTPAEGEIRKSENQGFKPFLILTPAEGEIRKSENRKFQTKPVYFQ